MTKEGESGEEICWNAGESEGLKREQRPICTRHMRRSGFANFVFFSPRRLEGFAGFRGTCVEQENDRGEASAYDRYRHLWAIGLLVNM